MKKTFITIYTILISMIYIFAISFFGFNAYKIYQKGQKQAANRLENMCLRIKMIPPSVKFNSDDFYEKMFSAIGNKSDFAFLEIKINDQEYYTYPMYNKPQNLNTKLVYSDSKNFVLNENRVVISADIFVIQPKEISIYLKYSLYIIIFATVLTAVIIIINNSTKDKKAVKETEKQNELEREVDMLLPGTHAVTQTQTENQIITQQNTQIEQPVTQQAQNVFENNDENKHQTFVNDILGKPNKDPAQEIINKETNEYKQNISNNKVSLPSDELKPMQIQQSKGPEGLFSPDTGFGWESYILTRLDNELNRATASEIDLALFIIRIPNVSRKDEITKKICEVISAHFQFKDLIFEFRNDCYVGLKIGSTSEQAFHFAEKILIDLNNVLNGLAKVYIGISTKTIRIISGERLFTEAVEALNHAIKDPESPIIAFKADADKYRQYIDNK